ncbi:phage tail tube protein [Humitalea sp. 24SJ18S-53]|uniref:phage tail tube protein n=1 Tax=Humitalea sp. 24SJ18S-53 TaxID=3422307 RepID=UPI003D66DE54
MAQTLGIIDIIWRNKRYKVDKGAKLKLGGMKGVPVERARSMDHAQAFEGSEVTATIQLERGMSLLDVCNPPTGELQALCDTGQTYNFAEAFLSNRPEATGGEGGKIELKWLAGEPEELLNG